MTKNAWFGYFWAGILENCFHIRNQHLRISVVSKFCEETKVPKFGTKNALLGIFDQECLIWVFLGNNYKGNCSHIWNQHPRFCLIVKFCEKTKIPKFGTKNVLFGYFWARILKNYCQIWNQHYQICQTVRFCEKTKMAIFGTKNALFGYFWARILKKYCHIWNQHPQICQK